MDAVIASLPQYWDGFLRTLYLSVISGVIALVVGTILAAMRVSPVAALRGFSMFYVEVARNTPLTIIFFFSAIVLPRLGILDLVEDVDQHRQHPHLLSPTDVSRSGTEVATGR